jgi:DNA polymerase II
MPSQTPAWLFDAYPHPRLSSLVVWVKHGSRVYKRYVPYRPEFCLRADSEPLEAAERLLAQDERVEAVWRDRAVLWLRGPSQDVLRVRPKRLQDIHAVATRLRRATRTKGFLFFDVDHQAECRWMHAQGLFSMCRLHVGPDGPELRQAPGEDRWSLDYPDPRLRTARLEVQARQAGHVPDFGDALEHIRLGTEEVECDEPGNAGAEREALLEFGRRLRRLDPDVLLTRHGDRWDIPYLLRRLRRLGIDHLVQLGREHDPHPEHPDQQAQSIHTYGRWLFKTHAYYLRGRWHIDLSKKTLDSEDDRKDLHGILYLARTSNRRAQDVNRNGAGYALQQMQIDLATDRGVALPWKRNLAEDWKDAATLCAVDRGGQIMNPEPGLYEDVAACDYSGYYPSIVVAHNLSSDTLNCTCCPDGELVPELGYHICKKEGRGHQAEILFRLSPHRRHVKAILRRAEFLGGVDEDLVAKARAIKSEQKAIGVVCFGYFRYRNARFGCAEVHQAIQCYGRDGMTRARAVARSMGFEMIHAMTDCTFLHKPGVTRDQARRVARRIGQEVGVPMDVEGVYKWIVFLPSKTHSTSSDVGVPNRYYGLFEDGRLKVRGIEVQRHSTPHWIYDAQQGMLDVFIQAKDAQGFRERIPQALEVAKAAADRLRARAVEPEKLGIMVQARMSVEEYRAQTNTKGALRRLRDAGTERHPGEYVQYIVARKEGPHGGRAIPVELLRSRSSWFGQTPPPYHVDAYLRLLARSVETMLSPFGYTEEDLLEWLRGRSRTPKPTPSRRVDPPRRRS